MRPDEKHDHCQDIPTSNASEHDAEEGTTVDDTIELPNVATETTFHEFEDGVRIVGFDGGILAFAGTEDQIQRSQSSGQAYHWQHSGTNLVAAVPGERLADRKDHGIYKLCVIPMVIGLGDGSSFAIVDCPREVPIQQGEATTASLEDGTIVFGISGARIDTDASTDSYQFDFVPVLRTLPSGEILVRGPAEGIIENESLQALTPDGRNLVVIPRERIAKVEDGTVIHRAHKEAYNNDLTAFRDAATKFARANNTFVFFYNGQIDDRGFDKLVQECEKALRTSPRTKERNRVLLILVTQGGDPHAAYRCARYLWHNFRGYQILIPGWCKSAGTLLAMGADEIYISDFGELGPIDPQVPEKDADLRDSSATLRASLDAIRENSYQAFDHYMNELGRYPSMTFQTRSEISTKLTNEIHSSISGKIDPRELGKMHRYLKLCYEYGVRLSARSMNIDEAGVRKLVYDYPQHDFVIDQYEARDLFLNRISEELDGFGDILGHIGPLSWRLRFPYSQGRQIIETIATPHGKV